MRQIRKLEGSIGRAIIGHNWKAGETLPLKTLGANPPSGIKIKPPEIQHTYSERFCLPCSFIWGNASEGEVAPTPHTNGGTSTTSLAPTTGMVAIAKGIYVSSAEVFLVKECIMAVDLTQALG